MVDVTRGWIVLWEALEEGKRANHNPTSHPVHRIENIRKKKKIPCIPIEPNRTVVSDLTRRGLIDLSIA